MKPTLKINFFQFLLPLYLKRKGLCVSNWVFECLGNSVCSTSILAHFSVNCGFRNSEGTKKYLLEAYKTKKEIKKK
jgi:hypothetical protein